MTALPIPVVTIGLLVASNIFMTFAWYGHLKFKETALITVILVIWGIAFFEYVLQVPANRIGHGYFSAAELKTIQEVITLSVFAVFSVLYLKEPLMWNHLVLCLHRGRGVLHLPQMGVKVAIPHPDRCAVTVDKPDVKA